MTVKDKTIFPIMLLLGIIFFFVSKTLFNHMSQLDWDMLKNINQASFKVQLSFFAMFVCMGISMISCAMCAIIIINSESDNQEERRLDEISDCAVRGLKTRSIENEWN